MSVRRVRAVFVKELRHIVRDVRSLIMAIGLPAFLLVFFGFAISLDVDRIPTMIFDADGSPASRDLISRFAGSRFFRVAAFVNDDRMIEREIDAGSILLGIVIPRDFSEKTSASGQATVQLLLDGSDSNMAAIAKEYAEAAVRSYDSAIKQAAQNRRAGESLNPPVDARIRILYNSSLESKNYIVPGLIAVILMIISALLTSSTIAREWESGTMEQLLSTPVRPAELVLGKMFAFFIIGAVDTVISVLVSIWVFNVPLRGSVWLLAGASCIFLTCVLFWGIFLSAVTKSQLLAYQLGVITSFLPGFLLSGFIYAIENMPAPMQAVTYAVPARHFITVLKGIFLKGTGIETLWPSLVLLILYAVIIGAMTTRKLKTKLA
jgi:ABC-2 type transport system permease protein